MRVQKSYLQITILQKFKTDNKEYGRYIKYAYYFILRPEDDHDIFMEDFFESWQDLYTIRDQKKSAKIQKSICMKTIIFSHFLYNFF